GDWNVFAGQYFDIFDGRHVVRPEQLAAGGEQGIQPWWPRWISIDWGFEHPSAVYWHAARPDGAVITYREFVANHLSPRMLAQALPEQLLAGEGKGGGARGLIRSPAPLRRGPQERRIGGNLVTCRPRTDRPPRRR